MHVSHLVQRRKTPPDLLQEFPEAEPSRQVLPAPNQFGLNLRGKTKCKKGADKMENQPVPTPSEIWKILKEVSLGQKDNREQIKETDRLFRESKQEADRRKQEMDCWLLESKQETDRKIQESQQRYDQMRQKGQENLQKMAQKKQRGPTKTDPRK